VAESGNSHTTVERNNEPERVDIEKHQKSGVIDDPYGWMSGRLVFWRPESRASTMAQRDIIHSDQEMEELLAVHAVVAEQRRRMTDADIDTEIRELNELEAQSRGDGN
jgi:hypothetical protein